jgi:H+/Cl- antiporter ClcA
MISLKYRKAQAFTWLGIMALICIMGLFYIILDQPFQKITEITEGNFTGGRYEPAYDKIQTIWDYWLIAFLLGAILFGILVAMRKRDEI